jgi:hypothetical protein
MKEYLVPFLIYVFALPVLSFLGETFAYAARVLLSIGIVVFFWSKFKLKFKLHAPSVIIGVIIFIIWVGIDDLYPHIGGGEFVPTSIILLILKLLGMLVAAPLIEELFVRDFFNRYLVSTDWKNVKIGKFSVFSFILTVLLFGFSHSRWLAGILTGIILNILLMKTKRIENCIIAHFVANLFLATYVIINQAWYLW